MGDGMIKKGKVIIVRPESEFPELLVTVPDSWPHITLAPWYDVHHGHVLHASKMFKRHRAWFLNEPYTLGWNGGDFFENVVEGSPGIYSQSSIPDVQFHASVDLLTPMAPKLLFAIPGNHEARTLRRAGIDIAQLLAERIGIPYFPDYCLCTIKWRGLKFHICAHHGSGAAATPGGQRNAARKDMPWIGADLYWTGHLHQPIADIVYRTDYNQSTNRLVSRSSVVIISPSYLQYFGGYAAAKRLGPGSLGITVATLEANGNIITTLHAKGTRL
jgi:hypothetical protein